MIEPNFNAWDFLDSGDAAAVDARVLSALKRIERRTQRPWAMDDASLERWRLFRECISELLVRAVQRRQVH